jgi:uncharacterized protein YegP (UPF0339 family)
MADFATFSVYRTRSLRPSQRWAWRLRHINGSVLAVSGEGYRDRDEAYRQGMKVINGAYAGTPLL